MSDAWAERRNTLRAQIAARLQRVRGAMSDADFAHLVDDVVRTAERFAEIDAGTGARRVARLSQDGTEPLTSRPIRSTDEPQR
jgi:hypothetical protein